MFARAGRWIGSWFDYYVPEVLKALGTVAIAAVGLLQGRAEGLTWFISSWPGFIFLLAAVFTLLGTIWSVKRARATRPLKQENEKLKETLKSVGEHYFELCSAELSKILQNTLGYGHTERISVYRFRGEGFQIMGRYSERRDYNERGRIVYPADEGVIQRAWKGNGKAVAHLPDPHKEPERYYDALEKDWNIDRGTAKNFTMPSRQLVARVVYEPKDRHRVAIVVVESTKPRILEEDRIYEVIDGVEGEFVNDFLEKMESIEPDLQFSRERGF